MRSRSGYHGCFTAIVTPFKDGGVDMAALDRLVDEQVAAGVSGLVPCGTTGESPTLSHEEHREVIRRVVERVRGRVKVVAGCGSNSTEEALGLTRFAHEVGADGTLQVVPYYNKPTPEGLYRHFQAIAKATPRTVILYNIPGRTGVNMAPSLVARLSKIENIVAIKEAAGSLDQVSEILDVCDIDVLSGDDNLTLPMMSVGALGVISVASNIVPEDEVALCRSFLEGAPDRALALHRKLFPLVKALFIESNPAPVKTAMMLLGRGNGELRLPLVPLEPQNLGKLRDAMARYGLTPR